MRQTKPFEALAPFYDRSYGEKLYDLESKRLNTFIRTLIKKRQINLLDLGCGTGRHIQWFSKLGYICTGVDISSKMTALAKLKLANISPRPKIVRADLKHLNLHQKFDVVISLFHVLSYMVTDAAIDAFFQTARRQLSPGGIFIFDCWNGKSVLKNLPEIRYKKVLFPDGVLHRVKIPTLDRAGHLVEVIHHGFLLKSSRTTARHFEEKHLLRYFFPKEIKRFASCNGFSMIDVTRDVKKLSDQWGMIYVCKLNQA